MNKLSLVFGTADMMKVWMAISVIIGMKIGTYIILLGNPKFVVLAYEINNKDQ